MVNHFNAQYRKQAEDGSEVTIFLDSHKAWFVGKKGDRRLDPQPLGAFRSLEAAKRWADHQFEGGDWTSVA